MFTIFGVGGTRPGNLTKCSKLYCSRFRDFDSVISANRNSRICERLNLESLT